MSYEARRPRQNCLVISGVEVFQECERDGVSFGTKWLGDACRTVVIRERDGALTPIHIDRDIVGWARFSHFDVARRKLAIFFDLAITNAEAIERVIRGELPHISAACVCDPPDIIEIRLHPESEALYLPDTPDLRIDLPRWGVPDDAGNVFSQS